MINKLKAWDNINFIFPFLDLQRNGLTPLSLTRRSPALISIESSTVNTPYSFTLDWRKSISSQGCSFTKYHVIYFLIHTPQHFHWAPLFRIRSFIKPARCSCFISLNPCFLRYLECQLKPKPSSHLTINFVVRMKTIVHLISKIHHAKLTQFSKQSHYFLSKRKGIFDKEYSFAANKSEISSR